MAEIEDKARVKQGCKSTHLTCFTFFSDVISPEVMFSIQVPLQTNQLPHRGQLQYLSRLENKNLI